ncbi:TPA: hypothetical protein ACH3X3_003608 [Trebouxia sp. C0006]
MPGLLQTPEGRFRSAKFVYALLAEAIGVLLFTFAATASVSPQQTAPWAPWGNGIALALSVYITANISGGHVNPAVTLAAMLTGHISIVKGLAFIIFQISGACLGTLMIAGLVPGSYVGMGNHGTGCFTTAPGVSLGMLFGWKAVMTFVLVSVVYAVAIGDPSFGAMGPLAIGLSLLAMVFAGLNYTGTAINPAHALGPAIVFHCHWDKVWLYVIAECVGGLAAGLMAGPLYGAHAPCLVSLLPWLTNEEEQHFTADLESEAPSVTGLSRQQDADSPLQLYGGKGKTVVKQAEGQHESTSEV